MKPVRHTPSRRSGRMARGFTLAEVAVTIALIGLALAWLLQVLNAAKLTAAYSRNLKLARELALMTMGQVESGLLVDELDDQRADGNYAEENYPDFYYEVVIGDENFRPDENDRQAFDNWRHEQDQKRRNSTAEEEEEAEQPYEKIQVKVVFPKIQEMRNEFVLERWVPWKQLHPDEESTEETEAGGTADSGENQ